MKPFLLACLCFCLLAGLCAGQSRIVKPFDSDWRFFKGDVPGAETLAFPDKSWRLLDVPHDWSIEGPFDPKNPSGGAGGFLPSGVAWYRKHFSLPAESKGRRAIVKFDGVMGISDVWINGVHLGQRPDGYIGFEYDLTRNLNMGGDNVIAVKADTSLQPASRWYTGAGIYRHVWLVIADAVSIPNGGVFVSTPEVSDTRATVRVRTEIVNSSDSPRTLKVETTLAAPGGKVVKTDTSEALTISSGATETVERLMIVERPRRWDIDGPSLYRATVRIRSGSKVIDDVTQPFGIREFHFDPNTGFWLNGRNFKLKGACLHADGSAFGSAVPLSVWEYRLNALRDLGVNAIRTAHNPPAPEFLDLADKMGFLVIDELFDQWTIAKNPYDFHLYFTEWSKRDVRDTVRRDRNHPSIILWSAGNEIRDTPQPEIAIPILRGLVAAFHENDDTRPVTQALFRPNVSHDYENGLADLLDVVGQNYREKEILAAHKQKPTRKIVGTENSHDLNQWLAMRDNPEYSGQFIWAGIDYLGESSAWPNYAYGKGLLDRTALPRAIGYQRQSWWSDKPMVFIARRVAPAQSSPTDPGYEVAEQRRTQTLFGDWTPQDLSQHQENVEVYSNCDEVELFLNGRSLGVKEKPADDAPRNWNVPFEKGSIKAVGRNSGKEAATFELKTAGLPDKIILWPHNAVLGSSWDDVAFVSAAIVDAAGVVVPSASDIVEFAVSGPGRLAAADSGDNADHQPFQAPRRKAFQGRLVALVKATSAGNSGKISVTATSGSLKSATITITKEP